MLKTDDLRPNGLTDLKPPLLFLFFEHKEVVFDLT